VPDTKFKAVREKRTCCEHSEFALACPSDKGKLEAIYKIPQRRRIFLRSGLFEYAMQERISAIWLKFKFGEFRCN
jgi:hypothetical protein